MVAINWEDLCSWLGPVLVSSRASVPLPRGPELVTDSRTLKAGEWFVPIVGENFDGHEFLGEAFAKGAKGAFIAQDRFHKIPEFRKDRCIIVTDTLLALQKYASGWRDRMSGLQIVAVTGSAGKTTTKELTSGILRCAGPTFTTQASFNNEIGVPISLTRLDETHRYACLEFGARRPGNIEFLCQMARPNIVGLLNVGVAHLEIFGNAQALLDTKLEIFRMSPKDAIQVANRDDISIYQGAKDTRKKTVTFGFDPLADVRILSNIWQKDGHMLLNLSVQGEALNVEFRLCHEALPMNAAAAAALALAAGVSTKSIQEGLSQFSGVKGRYQVHRRGHLVIVDDSYNANPDSMRAGLHTFNRSFPTAKKIFVLGDMLELGSISEKAHYDLGEELVKEAHPALLVTVGERAETIGKGACAAGLQNRDWLRFKNVDDLLSNQPDWTSRGGAVYIKASNGIRLGKLVATLLGS